MRGFRESMRYLPIMRVICSKNDTRHTFENRKSMRQPWKSRSPVRRENE
jgi:hypothetical protein